jgi:hypothetical protein
MIPSTLGSLKYLEQDIAQHCGLRPPLTVDRLQFWHRQVLGMIYDIENPPVPVKNTHATDLANAIGAVRAKRRELRGESDACTLPIYLR